MEVCAGRLGHEGRSRGFAHSLQISRPAAPHLIYCSREIRQVSTRAAHHHRHLGSRQRSAFPLPRKRVSEAPQPRQAGKKAIKKASFFLFYEKIVLLLRPIPFANRPQTFYRQHIANKGFTKPRRGARVAEEARRESV